MRGMMMKKDGKDLEYDEITDTMNPNPRGIPLSLGLLEMRRYRV
jgi:hypothetical protein